MEKDNKNAEQGTLLEGIFPLPTTTKADYSCEQILSETDVFCKAKSMRATSIKTWEGPRPIQDMVDTNELDAKLIESKLDLSDFSPSKSYCLDFVPAPLPYKHIR